MIGPRTLSLNTVEHEVGPACLVRFSTHRFYSTPSVYIILSSKYVHAMSVARYTLLDVYGCSLTTFLERGFSANAEDVVVVFKLKKEVGDAAQYMSVH